MSENNFNGPFGTGTTTIKIDRSIEVEREKERAEKAEKELAEFKTADYNRRLNDLPEKYKISCTPESLTSMEQLAQNEKELEPLNNNTLKAKGAIPPNSTAGGVGKDPRKSYDSMSSLYSDIKAKAMAGNAESEKILNTWFSNLLTANRNGELLAVTGKIKEFDNGKPISQIFNENLRTRIKVKGDA